MKTSLFSPPLHFAMKINSAIVSTVEVSVENRSRGETIGYTHGITQTDKVGLCYFKIKE